MFDFTKKVRLLVTSVSHRTETFSICLSLITAILLLNTVSVTRYELVEERKPLVLSLFYYKLLFKTSNYAVGTFSIR